jgi:hypothetical protein
MTRVRRLAATGLVAALVLAAGCGKKSEPESPPEPNSNPGAPTPGGEIEKLAKAEAARRLKQVGLAMHSFESAFGHLPAGIVGPKGELGLSWRVQILPYLEGEKEAAALFKQFNLKERWDSEHNRKLIEKMPKVFESPGQAAPAGKTYLRSFAGESALITLPPAGAVPKGRKAAPPFPHLQPGTAVPARSFVGITDGSSNTLAVAEAAEPVEWTKPDELPFPGFPGGPNPPPVPKLGGPFAGGFHGLMCDGAVRFFPNTIPDKVLSGMITATGGEVLGKEATDVLFPPKPKEGAPPTSVPTTLPDAAARATAVANYQKILKGMHDHHDANGFMPAGFFSDKAIGLSWRVQVLPYIGQEALYKEFRAAEPWDSEHNRKLIERMPKVFESPGKPAPEGHTFVRTTTGPGGVIRTAPDGRVQFRPAGQAVFGPKISNFLDGLSNTILFVEAADAVPWTKPEELSFAGPGQPVMGKGGRYELPKDPRVPKLGGVFPDGFHAVMAEGRVTFYKAGYPAGELAKLLCPNDGYVVEPLGPSEQVLYSIPPAPAAPAKGMLKEYGPPK